MEGEEVRIQKYNSGYVALSRIGCSEDSCIVRCIRYGMEGIYRFQRKHDPSGGFCTEGCVGSAGEAYLEFVYLPREFIWGIRFNCRTLFLGFGMYLFRKVKMKIGIYSPYLDTLGGGERYMISLASHWSKSHEVSVYWDSKTSYMKRGRDLIWMYRTLYLSEYFSHGSFVQKFGHMKLTFCLF